MRLRGMMLPGKGVEERTVPVGLSWREKGSLIMPLTAEKLPATQPWGGDGGGLHEGFAFAEAFVVDHEEEFVAAVD